MEEQYFYSASTGGFYLLSMRPVYEKSMNGWPDDAVSISEKWYYYLKEKSSTQAIVSNEYGQPVLSTVSPEATIK
ncbi:hypothetical protein QCA88_004265 [Escherichia coli]|nr:hypothetical protein [Escherichia coli]